MKRRNFIQSGSTALALIMLESHFLNAGCYFSSSPKNLNDSPLIQSLELLTTSSIAEMKQFYKELIGLPVIEENTDRIVFKTGLSKLCFTKSTIQSRPFYHFAFNIPENKIIKAYEWQKKKTTIVLPRPGMQLNDEKDFPNDIVHFRHWNAHSVFFLDPAGNLVEYIARHDLKNAAEGNFSAEDILYLSEIGLISESVNEIADPIKTKLSLQQYRNADERFQAIGDEHGLLLTIKKGTIWTGHPGRENKTGTFKTTVYLNKTGNNNLKPENYPYEIILKK